MSDDASKRSHAPFGGCSRRRAFGKVLQSNFNPHPWLSGPHLQTIYGAMRPLPELDLRKERLELPDGDFVDLGWSGEHNADGPLAVLVHGLTGGFTSKYLLGTARHLVDRGWRTVALQLRGAGPEPNRLHRNYNQGDTEDLRYLWHLLRQREPSAFIASVGWSLGGNVSLKALAEEGDQAPIDVAAAASVPFHIRPCAERLNSGLSRIYQKRLLEDVKIALRRKHLTVPVSPLVDLKAALAARNFIEFDQAYTAPLAGYGTVDEYYEGSSCAQFLSHIRCETLVVHAEDDPFMTDAIIPSKSALSPMVTLEVAPAGGHVGFVSSDARGRPFFWLDQHLADYCQEVFAHQGRQKSPLVS